VEEYEAQHEDKDLSRPVAFVVLILILLIVIFQRLIDFQTASTAAASNRIDCAQHLDARPPHRRLVLLFLEDADQYRDQAVVKALWKAGLCSHAHRSVGLVRRRCECYAGCVHWR
jgi:hypothetical protein